MSVPNNLRHRRGMAVLTNKDNLRVGAENTRSLAIENDGRGTHLLLFVDEQEKGINVDKD